MRLSRSPRPGSPAHSLCPLAKILIIDDDPLVLDAVTQFLCDSGRQVVAASLGRAGLVLARLEQPDLILLDLCLPDLDGLTVLRILKADSLTRGIPVVAITATMDGNRMTAAGCVGYMPKPFDAHTFADDITAFLRVSTRPTSDR